MTYLSPERSTEKREERTVAADSQFHEARATAAAAGLLLSRATRYQYQLRGGGPRGWLVNIYPSNRRVYHDSVRPGPFLQLPAEWDLKDVVRAAVGNMEVKDHAR